VDFGSTPAPKGFAIVPRSGPPTLIYRTFGGGLGIFMIVLLLLFGTGCFALTQWSLDPTRPDLGKTRVACFMFWLLELFLLGLVLWIYFGRTTFVFHPHSLFVERRLWCFRRSREFLKSEIRSVEQVEDGDDEGTHPSWGLYLRGAMGARDGKVLHGAPLDHAAWLGPAIAKWAGVPYEPASEQK
jgi:hypothetical protein